MQSNLQLKSRKKLHVAIIMDGNGRWAKGKNLPRELGHVAGVDAIHRILECAPQLGVTMLTLYSFSYDNWKRPKSEVDGLLAITKEYLNSTAEHLARPNVRFMAIGRRDRLPKDVLDAIKYAEVLTAHGRSLTARVAIDYSSRDTMLRIIAAAREIENLDRETFSKLLSGTEEACDVDLLIRTSGERRLSDFLLWECAYCEFYFTQRLWPDFTGDDLKAAVQDYHGRERRFA